MEVIKDRKDELADLMTKYEEIADKESTDIILARISAIHAEIVDIDAKIRALGDIGTLQQRVTDLTPTVSGHTTSIGVLDTTVDGLNTTIGGHTTSINGLDTRTNGMIDYVIESQNPTAENNYTWYRKYKSGWVEQGGFVQLQGQTNKTINLPITMLDNNYCVQVTGIYADATNAYGNQCNSRTTTGIIIKVGSYSSSDIVGASWHVTGMFLE